MFTRLVSIRFLVCTFKYFKNLDMIVCYRVLFFIRKNCNLSSWIWTIHLFILLGLIFPNYSRVFSFFDNSNYVFFFKYDYCMWQMNSQRLREALWCFVVSSTTWISVYSSSLDGMHISLLFFVFTITKKSKITLSVVGSRQYDYSWGVLWFACATFDTFG